MVYKEQDFVANINKALKYEDHKAVYDILTTEIAHIIAGNKPAFIKALQDTGLSIPSDITDKALIKVACHAVVYGKEKIIRAIIRAIAQNKEEWSNDLFGMIGSVAQGAEQIAAAGVTAAGQVKAAKEGTKQAQIKADADVQNTRLTELVNLATAKLDVKKAAMTLQSQQGAGGSNVASGVGGAGNGGGGSSKTLMIIGGVTLAILLVGGAVFYMKSKGQTQEA